MFIGEDSKNPNYFYNYAMKSPFFLWYILAFMQLMFFFLLSGLFFAFVISEPKKMVNFKL